MKNFKLMIIVIVSTVLFLGSANLSEAKAKEGQMSLKEKKEVALNVSKAIMNGNWGKVDELLDDNFTYTGDGAPPINKQEYIGFMKNVLCSAMTEMDMKFIRVIAEDDMVAVEYTNKMKHTGTFFGIPATNKVVLATGHFIREVKNGKVTAEWQTTNALGLMQQLGAIPSKKK